MNTRKKPTIEEYKDAGASLRLLYNAAMLTITPANKIFNASDLARLKRIIELISKLKCAGDDNLFRDHPSISNDYIDVFYGRFELPPRNKLDAEIIATAKAKALSLFE